MKNKIYVLGGILIIISLFIIFSVFRQPDTESVAALNEEDFKSEELELIDEPTEPTNELPDAIEEEYVVDEIEIVPMVVLLDPGHGDNDYGAPIGSVFEKNIVLTLAQKIKAILDEHPEVTVYMTREDDSYITLEERVALSKELEAAFMVSIHCNSNPVETLSGTETYYSANAEDIATTLHESLLAEIGSKDRKARLDEGYYILRTAEVPTMIMEVGYMTNPEEFEKLKSDEYQQKIAEGISAGILKLAQ